MKKNKRTRSDRVNEVKNLISYNAFEKEFFPSSYEERKREASLRNGTYYVKLAKKIVYQEDN